MIEALPLAADSATPAEIKKPLGEARDYRKMFDDARQALDIPRLNARKARDYYDDRQLSAEQRKVLLSRRQPEYIENEVKPAVNGILGILQQAKVDPRAYPRNPQDESAADVASKTLRYIADVARFHKQKIDAADNHLVEGAAAGIVEIDGRGDVVVSRIRFEEFFFDPRSREADYKDARYLGVAKWMYADDVAALYPDYKEEIGTVLSGTATTAFGGIDSTWEDRPDNLIPWIDRKQRRVMVVEMYHRKGPEWRRCVFFAGGVFEEGPSPYLDEYGETRCPIEASSCYIDRENYRYGIVQSMIPLQDAINARESRMLHLTNSRQLQVRPDAMAQVDADTARAEAARADGVLPVGYEAVPTSDMFQGNLLMLQEAKRAITRQAPTPQALSMEGGSSQSGRARLVRQQAGMTELARALGRFEDWENRMYRQMWLCARQFWTGPKWIRVTDDEGAAEFVQLNEPQYAMQTTPTTDPATGATVMVQKPQITGMKNALAQMDMDIIVDTVPDTANLAAEQFEVCAQLAPQMVAAFGLKATVLGLLKLSGIPGKQQIRDDLEQGAAEQAQQMAQQAQLQQQIAMRGAELEEAAKVADIDKTRADTEKTRAETAKTGAQAQGQELYNAEQLYMPRADVVPMGG